jgi:hypothetical protein
MLQLILCIYVCLLHDRSRGGRRVTSRVLPGVFGDVRRLFLSSRLNLGDESAADQAIVGRSPAKLS